MKKSDDKEKSILERMLNYNESLKDEMKALKGLMKSLQIKNTSHKAKILELEKDLSTVKEKTKIEKKVFEKTV